MRFDQWREVELKKAKAAGDPPLYIFYKGEEYLILNFKIKHGNSRYFSAERMSRLRTSWASPMPEVTISLEYTKKDRIGKISYINHNWYSLSKDLFWYETNSANFIKDSNE